MFPTANSTIYRNEAGEPIGFSDESYYEPDPYDEDFYEYDQYDRDDDDNNEDDCFS